MRFCCGFEHNGCIVGGCGRRMARLVDERQRRLMTGSARSQRGRDVGEQQRSRELCEGLRLMQPWRGGGDKERRRRCCRVCVLDGNEHGGSALTMIGLRSAAGLLGGRGGPHGHCHNGHDVEETSVGVGARAVVGNVATRHGYARSGRGGAEGGMGRRYMGSGASGTALQDRDGEGRLSSTDIGGSVTRAELDDGDSTWRLEGAAAGDVGALRDLRSRLGGDRCCGGAGGGWAVGGGSHGEEVMLTGEEVSGVVVKRLDGAGKGELKGEIGDGEGAGFRLGCSELRALRGCS